MRISRKCLAALLASCVGLASVAVADRIPAPDPGPSGWLESFDALDVNRWHATPRSQPPFWLGRGLSGRWDEANVAVTGGDLVLTAVVRDGYAEAAELQSRERLHYGTYEMAVMAEPIEGMIAGVFSYTPDSETEIDFEFEGRDPGVLHAVTWRTVHTKEHTAHTSGQPMSGRWLRLR